MIKGLFQLKGGAGDRDIQLVKANIPLLKKVAEAKESLDVFLGDILAYKAFGKLGKEAPLRSSAADSVNEENLTLDIDYVYPKTPVYKSNKVVVLFEFEGKMYLFESTIAHVDRAAESITLDLPVKIELNEKRTAFRVNTSRYNIKVSLKNITQTEKGQSEGKIATVEYVGKAFDLSDRGLLFMALVPMTVAVNDIVHIQFSLPPRANLVGGAVDTLGRVAHVRSLNRFCGIELLSAEQTAKTPFAKAYPYSLSGENRTALGRFCRAVNIENLQKEKFLDLGEKNIEEEEKVDIIILGDRKNRYYNNDVFDRAFQKHFLAGESKIIEYLRTHHESAVVYDNTADKDEAGIEMSWNDLVKTLRSSKMMNRIYILDNSEIDELKKAKLKAFRVFYCHTSSMRHPSDFISLLNGRG
ncbi:hypothetical protein [Chrysiogenes arsenatis]|uniref:hypothetical protein n=1 Tax=Chrysiogenes arsenatis TaxID=309797 RepID=UPI00040C653A|nr:hypothetical protein [Chrysiogenes arsenatis]